MRASIAESITNTVADLNKSGLVNDITRKNVESLSLSRDQEYSQKLL